MVSASPAALLLLIRERLLRLAAGGGVVALPAYVAGTRRWGRAPAAHPQKHTGRHMHRGQHTFHGDDLLCCCICQLPRHECVARGQRCCRQMLRASLAGIRQPWVALWKQVLHVAVAVASLPPVAAVLTC